MNPRCRNDERPENYTESLNHVGKYVQIAVVHRFNFQGQPIVRVPQERRGELRQVTGSGSFVVTAAFPRRASCTPTARRSAIYWTQVRVRLRASGYADAGRHTAQRTRDISPPQVLVLRPTGLGPCIHPLARTARCWIGWSAWRPRCPACATWRLVRARGR